MTPTPSKICFYNQQGFILCSVLGLREGRTVFISHRTFPLNISLEVKLRLIFKEAVSLSPPEILVKAVLSLWSEVSALILSNRELR
jgi:hypothetical protein